MRTFALVAVAAATVSFVGFYSPVSSSSHCPATSLSRQRSNAAIDAIIGNGRYNGVHPVGRGSLAEQRGEMTQRLTYLETLLRGRDVSDWPAELQAERGRNLDRLRDYRLRGIYPANYDHPEAQKPCFIDRDGHICAVGYLVEQSAGREFAEKINSRYQYATVAEMHMPEIDRWIGNSGLTPAEVRTIQEPGGLTFTQDIRVDSPMPQDTVTLTSFRGTSLEGYMKRPQPDSASVDISGAESYQRALYAAFGTKPAELAAR